MKVRNADLKPRPEIDPARTTATPNPAAVVRPRHTTLSAAFRYQLGQTVPGDRQGRTHAERIADAVLSQALHGDLRAVRLIIDFTAAPTEGKDKGGVILELPEPLKEPEDRTIEPTKKGPIVNFHEKAESNVEEWDT